jgi:CHAD domain-containing protein
MAYRLESDETVRDGLIRTAEEQLAQAASELRDTFETDPVEAVHSARKAIKKERSLLRLVRGAIPPGQRRGENRALREIAHGLAGSRDAAAMEQTVQALSQRYAGQLPQTTFEAVRRELEADSIAAQTAPSGPALNLRAAEELDAVRSRVSGWRLGDGDWPVIEAGLLRSYRSGRAACRHARSHRSTEGWHEWRKRAKDLWYQERLLAGVAGPTVAGHVRDVHRLADLLGDDHDLGVLRQALAGGRIDVAADLDAVVELIDRRRAELQSDALRVGRRVYAEKPAAYARRMRRSWSAGRPRAAQAASA